MRILMNPFGLLGECVYEIKIILRLLVMVVI